MTATMTLQPAALPSLSSAEGSSPACCPNCGFVVPALEETQAALDEARRRISDLEAQVRLLNQKATAAVDRWADYEDEIARLRQQAQRQQQEAQQAAQQVKSLAPSPEPASPARASFLQTGTNRLSQLLSPRKSTPNLHDTNNPPVSPSSAAAAGRPYMPRSATDAEALIAALTREKSLRKQAEGKLTETSREVEELSVSLFEQANEMVATERRARAALEERVGELERRDRDKAKIWVLDEFMTRTYSCIPSRRLHRPAALSLIPMLLAGAPGAQRLLSIAISCRRARP